MENKIIIASEGLGYEWGHKIINKLLLKLYPNASIIKSNHNPNFIMRSWCLHAEGIFNNIPNKYIYWSGETKENKIVNKSKFHTKYLNIITNLPTEDNDNTLYIPYVLYSDYLYNHRINNNINRPFILAYCAGNKTEFRENIFNKFVKNTDINICHALGNCCGNYPQAKRKVSGDWKDICLINKYSNYKFVLACENTKSDGYVTEKILNAFYSGAIPIYWGSDNINELFNKKAFINISNFDTIDACIKYVINLSDDERKNYIREPIYNENSELINLVNDNYNKNNENKVLKEYLKKISDFLK